MLALALFFAAVLAAACGGDSHNNDSTDPDAPARSFMMGFSSVPRELNSTAYADAFKLAAEHGEMVLIQRTPRWSEFVDGGSVSSETEMTTAAEKHSIDSEHLSLFFAIDPTDGSTGRDRLAELPASLQGKNFGDASIRSAFVSYAKYVALNYRPAYMALGVDMNQYYEKDRADFENFKSLYDEAYDAVKQIAPDTQITVTFQYEDLVGKLPTQDAHDPDWALVKSFRSRLDLMAISTYPNLAFPTAADIPATYYSQLRAFTDKPIAIADMGYSSSKGGASQGGASEADQAKFVQRALSDAEQLNMPFVVWFAGWDPTFARDSAYSVFQHIGLLRDDSSEKPAWRYWVEAARRPYRAG